MHPKIYEEFASAKGYDAGLKIVIERTGEQLKAMDPNVIRPGMLLGNIQSGKTKAFIGIIARAFDKGYDIAVVFNKGTKALSMQAVQRLSNEFETFIKDDEMNVYDIMALQDDLNDFILDQKLIFVVKKEDANLRRLDGTFHEVYPQLGGRTHLSSMKW